MKEVPTCCWCPEQQALDLDLVMEVEPPLYPVAGAAGPQGDEDRLGVPDGPEAPVSRAGNTMGYWADWPAEHPGGEGPWDGGSLYPRMRGGAPDWGPGSQSRDTLRNRGWGSEWKTGVQNREHGFREETRTLGQGDRDPEL